MNIFYIDENEDLGVFYTYEGFQKEKEKKLISTISQKEAFERYGFKKVNEIKDHIKLFFYIEEDEIKEVFSEKKEEGYFTELEMIKRGYRKKLSDFFLLNHEMIYLGKIKCNSSGIKEKIAEFLGTTVYSGALFKFKADVFGCKRKEYIYHKYVGKNTYEIYAILQY